MRHPLCIKNLYVSADSNVKMINFDLQNKLSQRITRNGSDVYIYRLSKKSSGTKSYLSIRHQAAEFDPDEYQKFKYHHYIQKSYTSYRASITTWEQNPKLLNIKFDLRQFLHTICCGKRCNTNQFGKITINVKLLGFLIDRYIYTFFIVYCNDGYCSMFIK